MIEPNTIINNRNNNNNTVIFSKSGRRDSKTERERKKAVSWKCRARNYIHIRCLLLWHIFFCISLVFIRLWSQYHRPIEIIFLYFVVLVGDSITSNLSYIWASSVNRFNITKFTKNYCFALAISDEIQRQFRFCCNISIELTCLLIWCILSFSHTFCVYFSFSLLFITFLSRLSLPLFSSLPLSFSLNSSLSLLHLPRLPFLGFFLCFLFPAHFLSMKNDEVHHFQLILIELNGFCS